MTLSDPATWFEDWRDILADSTVAAEDLRGLPSVDIAAVRRVIDRYPMRINPYYRTLIEAGSEAARRQAIPDIRELDAGNYQEGAIGSSAG